MPSNSMNFAPGCLANLYQILVKRIAKTAYIEYIIEAEC